MATSNIDESYWGNWSQWQLNITFYHNIYEEQLIFSAYIDRDVCVGLWTVTIKFQLLILDGSPGSIKNLNLKLQITKF